MDKKSTLNRIRPLGDRVLIKRLAGEDKTVGGIIIPNDSQEISQIGGVIATGPGREEGGKLIPLQVKVGDIVYFGKFAGAPFFDDEHVIMNESEILGVIVE